MLQDLLDDPNNELMIPEDPECNKEGKTLSDNYDYSVLFRFCPILFRICKGKKHISTPIPHDSYSVLSVSSSGKPKRIKADVNILQHTLAVLLAVCLGGAVSLTFIVWIQIHKGWDWGFGIGTTAMLLGIIIFAAALPLYRIHPAKGTSALLEIVQVYVAAIRNRRLTLPEDPAELYAIEQDREATLETEFLPHRDIYSDIGVTFDDIGALENVKDTLKELVMLPLQTMLAKETKGEKIEDGVGSSCSSIYLCGSPSSNGCYCHGLALDHTLQGWFFSPTITLMK
ncbi:hypothetical protein HN51_047182 [Arachis hypogaea]